MNIEELREYCLSKPHATECFPFDLNTLVFKVHGKMFALTDLEGDLYVNLKCDPEQAIELREQYPHHVLPGYHMSKKHWNTIKLNDYLSDQLICQWIDHSYNLVWASLPKRLRQ